MSVHRFPFSDEQRTMRYSHYIKFFFTVFLKQYIQMVLAAINLGTLKK